MKKLFTFISILIAASAVAQNYACLSPTGRQYFTNSFGYLRGIRIDSVRTVGASEVYYPYRTPRGYYPPFGGPSPTLLNAAGGSWLGKNVIKQPDGTFLFDNLWHDTVVVKTQANVGDSWIFYNDTTSLYYQAEVISAGTMTLPSGVDSVKTILITARNPSGIVTIDPADSFTIILSKNHGFAQVFDLYTFPYHGPDSIYQQGLDYYLDYTIKMGVTLLPTVQNSIFSVVELTDPTLPELTQWNVGDIYEYSSCQSSFEHTGYVCSPVEHYRMDTITSLTPLTGALSVSMSGWFADYFTLGGAPPNYHYSYGLSGVNIDSVLVIDTLIMPEEYQATSLKPNQYQYLPGDTSYCVTGTSYATLGYGTNGFISGAFYQPVFELFVGPTYYKAPLGLLSSFRASAGSSGFYVQSQNLLWYRRGVTSCGTLVIPPTEVPSVKKAVDIELTPNPASNTLNITAFDDITSLVITNTVGQKMLYKKCNSTHAEIDVSTLPPGLYLLRINNDLVTKFVKE